MHLVYTASDIHRWGAMKRRKFNRLSFSKIVLTIALGSNPPVEIECIYDGPMIKIEACHKGAATLFSYLINLVSTDSFTNNVLPLTSYNGYHEAFAFFTKLANYIRCMFKEPRLAVYAPTASQGPRLIQLSDTNGLSMFFCMLSHIMPLIGALGFNHQKLIDALVLINGNNVYEFMASSLKVKKSINVSRIHPSPNTLVSYLLDHQQCLQKP